MISKINIMCSFEFPEAWVALQTGSLFVGLTWPLTGIGEGKFLSLARSTYVKPCDLLDVFPQPIDEFHPLPVYFVP